MLTYKEQYSLPICNMLNLTDACNLACKYCFVEQHPHFMSLDVAKQAIDWTYQNYLKRKKYPKELMHDDNDKCQINFFGGEPLLCFNSIIVPLIEYTEKEYPNMFQFNITTNCTLLTKNVVDYFVEHNVIVLTSLDGDEITQNFNRPCQKETGKSSFDLIMENIPYFLEKYQRTAVFRATGYGPSVHNLFNSYKFAESLGYKMFEFIPDNRHDWTDEELNDLQIELIKVFNYRLEQRINNKPYMSVKSWDRNKLIFQNQFITEDVIDPFSKKNKTLEDTIMRCGLGTTSAAIGYDGKIYGCQQDVSYDKKNIFLIGDIYSGIDINLHQNLLNKYLEESQQPLMLSEKCQQCKLKNFCISYANVCASTSYYLTNNFFSCSKMHCFYANLIYKLSIIELLMINQIYTEQEGGL